MQQNIWIDMSEKKKEFADGTELVRNRKAFHDFMILEKHECGIVLAGTEVKSCRARSVSIQEGYAQVVKGELLVYGMHISPYGFGNRFNHETVRPRRLLMHKREILKLSQQVKEKGGTLVPLALYLKRGRVKLELGVAKGKTFSDKRETLKKKQDDMEARRAMAH